jgi:hypothetical protein
MARLEGHGSGGHPLRARSAMVRAYILSEPVVLSVAADILSVRAAP